MSSTEHYYSCDFIQNWVNFYPNNIIKICCFSDAPDVEICKTDEDIDDIIKSIILKKEQMIKDFSEGNICDSCKDCRYLIKGDWGKNAKRVSCVNLNHYMFCNLKCRHCGYSKAMETTELLDTSHKAVVNIIDNMIKNGITTKPLYLDIGGGEPSLSKGLIESVNHWVQSNNSIHISSNCARYVHDFADGVNRGSILLTLTPDAGSKEVYDYIKGADYFDIVWENIGKYMNSCDNGVRIKFILQEGNLHDIDNMIDMCVKTHVREVILNLDLNIKYQDYPMYVGYINKFKALCKKNSIPVSQGNFIPSYLWILQPDDPSPPLDFNSNSVETWTWRRIAETLLSLKEYAIAAEAFECAIALEANDPAIHFYHGVALAACGRELEALGAYKRVLCLQPDHPEALNNLGSILESQGRLTEASVCFERAVQTNPRFSTAVRNLGLLHVKLGRLDEAAGIFLQLLSLQPNHREALKELDDILNRLHQAEQSQAVKTAIHQMMSARQSLLEKGHEQTQSVDANAC